MDSCKTINRFSNKFEKLGRRVLKEISLEDYIKTYGHFQPNVVCEEDKDLFVTTSYFSNISVRRTIVKTLEDIKYKRGKNDWSEKVAIAFMEEVINLFLNEGNNEIVDTKIGEISKRYNVPTNRLKTQVALFLNNLEKGKDKFNILSYFSIYEIMEWKYRDVEKLQELIEADKLSAEDRKLLTKMNRIV